MGPFYRNWLRSIVDVQQDFPAADPLDKRACGTQGRAYCVGAVTDTVPHPPGTFGTRPADPSWSSTAEELRGLHAHNRSEGQHWAAALG